MSYKRNYNSLLPDDFELSEEFENIIEQLESTKDRSEERRVGKECER